MEAELAGLAVVVIVLLAGLCVARPSRKSAEEAGDKRGLPPELKGARLVHAERTFRSKRQGMVARLDRAYEVDGELVLVEFKTRRAPVVYASDVVELSVQRVALQDERQVQVSTTAWVVVEETTRRTRSAHRVRLLDSAEVQALRTRYLGVSSGTVHDARGAKSPKQCHHCSHRSVCGPGESERRPAFESLGRVTADEGARADQGCGLRTAGYPAAAVRTFARE
jgi:hypothetical protein